MTPGRDCRDCGVVLSPAGSDGDVLVCMKCGAVSIGQLTPAGRVEWRAPRPREWAILLMHSTVTLESVHFQWRDRDRLAAQRPARKQITWMISCADPTCERTVHGISLTTYLAHALARRNATARGWTGGRCPDHAGQSIMPLRTGVPR